MIKKRSRLAIFLSLICSFLIVSPLSKHNNEVVNLRAASNYDNYNYDAKKDGTNLPSELHYIKSGSKNDAGEVPDEVPTITDGRLLLTDGGESKFSPESSRPKGRRLIYFTLHEDVMVEFALYTTGSSKKFYIYYDDSNQFEFDLTKNVSSTVLYKFENIPSTGKEIKIGGKSSIYLEHIAFDVKKRAWFDANGGKFDDDSTKMTIEVEDESSDIINPPSNPKRENYVFVGWSESMTDVAIVNSFTYGKTYYAVWEPITGVNIYISDLVLYLDLNGSKKLTAHILPSKYSNLEISWSSDNETIASVDNDGLVTAKNYGSTYINAACQGVSAKCEVVVMKEYKINFYESYDKYVSGEIFATRDVFEDEGITYLPIFGSGKGYEVVWYVDKNNTKDNKNDDVEFDVDSTINSDLNIYAEVKILPVATLVTLSLKEDDNVINTTDNLEKASYYIKNFDSTSNISFEAILGRDDGRFEEIKDNQQFKDHQSDITYYSLNPDIATVDAKSGKITSLKPGKAEIYARLYENTSGYEAHQITSTSIIISTLGDKYVGDKKIDTNVYLEKPELGRFSDADGTQKAVRFIGYIKDEFFPYISNARFKVQAINNSDVVQKEFIYNVTSFSKTIDFVSKTPFTSSDFKSWSKKGYYGTSFTITNLPDQSFIGYFKVTFMVLEIETEIIVPNVKSINYRGVV